MLKERTKRILETSVMDFIKTGAPITSERLMRDYDFGIKSAMIRWELHDLSKSGFLEQVHASGGRIPSDKAYRFFADTLLSETGSEEDNNEIGRECLNLILEGRNKSFVKEMSDLLNTLSVFFELDNGSYEDSGLSSLFLNFDHFDKKTITAILSDIEVLPEKIIAQKNWWGEEDEWPQVFIGKNPLMKNRSLSLVVNKMPLKNKDCVVIAIGPKRMDYRKPISLFNVFNNFISN